jgi:translocation and assembly module TamB
LYVLGSLAALAALGVAILSTPWAQRFLERRMVAALESSTGTRVEIRSFDFRPLSLEFVLRGLVLHGTEPSGAPPMFSAKTVIARLRLRAIIERKPLFASLDWDEAEIHISMHPDGSTNLAGPPAQEGTGASVSRVTLSKTSVFWNDQRLRLDLEAGNLAILVRRTKSGQYAGSISAARVQIRGPKFELPRLSFTAQAEFSRAGLETQALSWQCAGIAGHGHLSISAWNPLGLRVTYQTEGDIRELAVVLGLHDVRAGKGNLQGTLTYQDKKFEAGGKVDFRQLEFHTGQEDLKGVSASANFSADSDHVSIQEMTGTLLDGNLRGAGEINLGDPAGEYQFQVRVDRLSARRIIQSFIARNAGDYISSRASGTVTATWKGHLHNFRGGYKLNFLPEGAERAGVLSLAGSLEGTSRFDPTLVLEIQQANFRTRSSAASARGTVGMLHANLALGISATDFEEWRSLIEPWVEAKQPIPLKLRSAATFRGEMAGPFRSLEWRGELSSGPFEFHGTRWDKLHAGITITPKLIQIAAGQLEYRDSQLHLEAEFPIEMGKLDSARPLRLSVNAEKTPLEGLLAALGEDIPVRGSLTGKMDLQGSLENSSGTGQVRVENGALYDEPFDALSASLVVERSVWHLNDTAWTKGHGQARGAGEVDYPARKFRFAISGSDIHLDEVKRLQASLDVSPSHLQGLMNFDVRAQGWTDTMDIDATGGIRNIVAGKSPIGDVTAHFTRNGERMEFSGKGEGPGGNFRFSGTKPATAGAPFSVDSEYQALRLDPWIQFFTARESLPKLTVAGTLHGKFSPADSNSTEISAQAAQFVIEYPTLILSAAQPVNVHYAARRMTIDRFNLHGPATSLAVEGTARLGQGGSIAISAEGKAEATLLNLVDPAVQASGESLLKVRMTGTFSHPALHGTMSIQNVNAGYGDLPFRITGLTGDVVLEGDRATLRSLEGTSGGGRVVLTGFVDFAAAAPRLNLQAELSQVRVRYPSVFTSVLDGTLRLAGSAERGEVSGDLVVHQIFAPENFNWLTHVGQAASSAGISRPAIKSPIAPRIRLNIRVKSSTAVRFESRDLRLVGDIDIRLQGTLAESVEVGHVQILSGEAVFRGNRYHIRRGDISLTNPFRTQSLLTLEAETRIQRYNLTVNLSGPFDRLKITYRSDPPLPTSDIVTLLAFGYARQQDEMATRSSHPAATVGASALVSQALSTQMSGRIQRLFGVSRIKIDPNAGGVATTGGALITVEQQVAPELTITYATNTGVSQYRIIRLEWAVSDRMSIIGERDQGGVFGMEVQFRQRFR